MQSPDHSNSAGSMPSGGQPLPQDVRLIMQQRLHADFSNVRVHPGVMNHQTLQTQAYTHNNQIAFCPGTYHPYSSQGQQLLAHELTHVVQQGQGYPIGNR